MAKHDEQQNDAVLSFDELKKKFADDGEENDAEVQALLSSLRDVDDTPQTAKPTEQEEPAPTPVAKEPTEPEAFKSIYDDVLRSVMEKSPDSEMTTGIVWCSVSILK